MGLPKGAEAQQRESKKGGKIAALSGKALKFG